jgi:hypothetical protein
MLGVPVSPCALVANVAVVAVPVRFPVTFPVRFPVTLPLKVVAVATPVTVKPLGKLGAPAPDLFLIVSTFMLDIALYLFRYL